MPPVIAAAAVSAASYGASVAVGAAVFSWAALGSSVAISAASSILNGALSSKPKSQQASLNSTKTGITRQFRQAVSERYVVYGEARVSGPIGFVADTQNNKYLHLIILVASHEIDSYQELIANDISIPMDAINGAGMVTSGPFANKMRVKFHLGAEDQAADSDLVSEVPEWTDAHRLRGIAYIYLRLEWDNDAYQGSIPSFSVWVKGKKIADTRDFALGETRVTEDGETRITEDGSIRVTETQEVTIVKKWTPNIALIAFDYLVDNSLGVNALYDDIDDATVDNSANICDEMVQTKNVIVTATSANSATDIITLSGETLPLFRGDRVQFGVTTIGGISEAQDYYVIPYQRQGTIRIKLANTLQDALDGVAVNITSSGTGTIIKNAEPRYHGGGLLSMTVQPKANIETIISGMAGSAVRAGRKWYINAGAYKTPEIELDEGDIHGSFKIDANAAKNRVFNKVTGTFISQINNGNPADYPVVQSSVYQDADLEILPKKLDLSFTQRPQTCQRIAKQLMERERQEITFSAQYHLGAYKLKPGDTFYKTFAKNGWTQKVFEVMELELSTRNDGNAPVPFVSIIAKETAEAAYLFTSADDEQLVDPAPNTNLPNPFLVQTVIGFGLTSVPVNTEGGDRVFKILASWEEHENPFVREGGEFEIQYKLTTTEAWRSLPPVNGNATAAELFQAELDYLYDLRIRAYNNLGAKSAWNTITGFLVGSTLVANTEDWENETELRNPSDWENDNGANEDWEI